ncbi:MAG: TPM domain-containing protein [Alphaproteobacteria bacterium]
MVNDFSSSLQVAYVNDLDLRLRRFNEKTGYAIVVVIIQTGEDEQISELIKRLFIKNQLKRWGVDGTVLLLITAKEGWVIAEPSERLENKFLRPGAAEGVPYFYDDEFKHWDAAVERRVEAVIRILDPWFYVLDPPSTNPTLILAHAPTAEVILLPLVPLLGLMIGMALMAFTTVGYWSGYQRFLVSGLFGCSAALASAFVLRRPGGITPGMVYYSGALGFVVAGMVAALKPYWFYETVRGRKPGEKMHPPFFGKG